MTDLENESKYIDDNSTAEYTNQQVVEEKASSSADESDALRNSSIFPRVPPEINSTKGTWTTEEDALLLSLMNSGFRCWTEISKSMAGRNPKQCRERWTEYIDPTLDRGKFSKEEDEIILREQLKVGHRWTAIAQMLPTKRTSTDVKVRFNSLLRKHRKGILLANQRESALGSSGAMSSVSFPPDFLKFPAKVEGQPSPQPSVQGIPVPPRTSSYFFLPFQIRESQFSIPVMPMSLPLSPPYTSGIPTPLAFHPESTIAHPLVPFSPPPQSIVNQSTSYYYPPPTHTISTTTSTSSDSYQSFPHQYDFQRVIQPFVQSHLRPDRQQSTYDYFHNNRGDYHDSRAYYPPSEVTHNPIFYPNIKASNTISKSNSFEHPPTWYSIPDPMRSRSSSSSNSSISQIFPLGSQIINRRSKRRPDDDHQQSSSNSCSNIPLENINSTASSSVTTSIGEIQEDNYPNISLDIISKLQEKKKSESHTSRNKRIKNEVSQIIDGSNIEHHPELSSSHLTKKEEETVNNGIQINSKETQESR